MTTRRRFLQSGVAAATAVATSQLRFAAPVAAQATKPERLVGIQAGAVSFVDEGVDAVLDVFQSASVNAIFLATFTYGRGIAGRQVPGQAFPDHGKQESDEGLFHGGNYATPHARFYERTALKPAHAPDFGDVDILETVLPKARAREMKVYAWYEDQFDRDDIPGVGPVREIALDGRPARTLCPLHTDYRGFLTGLTTDYCTSYDIDGVMWGSEREGPFNNAIRHPTDPAHAATCFCPLHKEAAKARNIDPERAIEGYTKLAALVKRAAVNDRPTDGYFVSLWRLLLDYPEILAWEKLWTDSKHAIYTDVHTAAKAAKPSVQVGFHIWHQNSFSPFFRAEQDYAAFAKHADYLKIVLYNNCGGPRYAHAIDTYANTIFRDVPADELQSFFDHVLNYENEKPHAQLPAAGLSADYVARETKRALADVAGQCRIYPGIDIDIPTGKEEKKTTPDDVYQSTRAALSAGAQGVVLSRKYSEMKLANLAAAAKAVHEVG